MSSDEEADVGLHAVDSLKESYVVETLLGEGSFGAVYKVRRESDKKYFAMKVEQKRDDRKHSKLKMEIHILKSIATVRTPSHFTPIVDRGKKDTFFFLIMQLVGKSLADLKASRPQRVFSLGTGIGVGIQCLEAAEDLHGMGFVHRDIKPANYASGLDEDKHVIYILDFGIARKVMKTAEDMKTPRLHVGFKGTVAFASLACHNNQDLAMKDDCESWFYLLLDLIVPSGLPWRRMDDDNDVKEFKTKIRNEEGMECERLFSGLPIKLNVELRKILMYLCDLQYVSPVDYDYIYKELREGARKCSVDPNAPYDWEQQDFGKSKYLR